MIQKMHRQSLGSPNSKLHSNGVLLEANDIIELTPDDLKTKHQLPPQLIAGDDEELRKSQKPQKSAEKLIHIIPMLIIFCFLILYLTSHDPSQNTGVNNLKGFNRNLKPIEMSSEIDELRGLSEIEKSGVTAIRSTRNLQQDEEEEILRKKRSRKLGHF